MLPSDCPINRVIASNLLALRKRKGLTQEEVARAVDITWRNYQRWEKGKVIPKPANVSKLARFYGTTEEKLLGLDGHVSRTPRETRSLVRDLAGEINAMVIKHEKLSARVRELEARAASVQSSASR